MRKRLLKIPWDAEGVFIERPNRFVGIVELPSEHGGKRDAAHVHDPGRLKELLYPGARVALKKAEGKGRKTAWTLVAAFHDGEWVLVNSGMHRKISQALISEYVVSPFGKAVHVEPEVRFGTSRLDYRLVTSDGEEVYVEVKGCTLAIDGVALFPDAPTKRGARHVQELMEVVAKGCRAALLVLIFRSNVRCFMPNALTDPLFASVFAKALNVGVEAYPVACSVQGGSVWYEGPVALCGDRENSVP